MEIGGSLNLIVSLLLVNSSDKSRKLGEGGMWVIGIWPFKKRTRERRCWIRKKKSLINLMTLKIMKTLNMTGTLTTKRGRIGRRDVKNHLFPWKMISFCDRRCIIYRVGGALPTPLCPPVVAYLTQIWK